METAASNGPNQVILRIYEEHTNNSKNSYDSWDKIPRKDPEFSETLYAELLPFVETYMEVVFHSTDL